MIRRLPVARTGFYYSPFPGNATIDFQTIATRRGRRSVLKSCFLCTVLWTFLDWISGSFPSGNPLLRIIYRLNFPINKVKTGIYQVDGCMDLLMREALQSKDQLPVVLLGKTNLPAPVRLVFSLTSENGKIFQLQHALCYGGPYIHQKSVFWLALAIDIFRDSIKGTTTPDKPSWMDCHMKSLFFLLYMASL